MSREAAAALICKLGCLTELLQSRARANVPTALINHKNKEEKLKFLFFILKTHNWVVNENYISQTSIRMFEHQISNRKYFLEDLRIDKSIYYIWIAIIKKKWLVWHKERKIYYEMPWSKQFGFQMYFKKREKQM